MRIHLARLNRQPHLDAPADAFAALAAQDTVAEHHLTASPDDADVVLFTQCHMLAGQDWRLDELRRHPLNQEFPEKVMVYDERDRPWCAFPGVYVSMPQPVFSTAHQRPWGYFRVPSTTEPCDPDLLFSFVASNSARCRRALFALEHPDAIVEEAQHFVFYDSTSRNYAAQRTRFQSVLARSRFVLCPRGRGTSSIRLYETLAAGRVPVVIADGWTPPMGPNWESFSIRWPENRTRGLVDMLEQRDRDWAQMSVHARETYDTYFSADLSFHRIASLCDDLRRSATRGGFPANGLRDRAYVQAGADAVRSRAVSALRSAGKRALRRGPEHPSP